jgi:hypothetical protein
VDAVLFLTDATFTTGEIRRSAKFVGRVGAELNMEESKTSRRRSGAEALRLP